MTVDSAGHQPLQSGVAPAERVANPSAEDKVNILIVDDRPDKLLSLEVALGELNQNLVLARSGKDALRCLLKEDFAVILLDVNMPGMDGFETAALIRRRPRSELTPIIFVSAINDKENHVTRGYSLGAVDYILAPVVPEILRAKVSVFVDLYRKTAQIRRQADERANRVRAEVARAEAEAARERSAFLAEASSVLASSFDPNETFTAMARLTVPRLADYCIVDVLEEDGSLRTLAVAYREGAKAEKLQGFRNRFPRDEERSFGPAEVLRTGKTEVCQRFSSAQLEAYASRREQAETLKELGIRSYILTPLRARGRMLGTLCLASTVERSFPEAEVTLIEELAQRAGLALDNAALYQAAERARDTAERASQAKDQFLAMLSHELRTPLTPVLNTVSLLESDPTLSEEIRGLVELIRRNVELEARLIDDLLDLTRVSKGKVQLNLETVETSQLIKSALEICQGDIAEKKLEVDLRLEAGRRYLRADPARLQQVFWNLIKNAVKFTPESGRLTVSTRDEPGGRLSVEVTDTGIGIERDMLSRVFNAFEQVGQGERLGGLGLGLAITKALVGMHHGEIFASSPGLDQGATFRVILPTVDAPSTQEENAPSTEETSERLSLKLLLVEDHEDTSRSLSRLLSKRGYEVRSAGTVQGALEEAALFNFDVLISDMGLPDGSGIHLMEQLCSSRLVRGIALSGYGMEEDIQRSKAVGFQEHLTKPVDIARLDEVIQRIGRICE